MSATAPSKDVDTWNTMEDHAWDKPQLKTSANIPFTAVGQKFPVGLNWLDIDNKANIRVECYTDAVTKDSFKIHIDAWSDTVLYSAGATWLQTNTNDRDFQCGQFKTSEDHPWDKPQKETSKKIKFAHPFCEPPKVVCWLNELDMDKKAHWRVKTYATDVTAEGFTIHIDTWGDTVLYTGTAAWIAHAADRPNIASGSYNTMDVRPWDKPKAETHGNVKFGRKFKCDPHVLVALNWLDIGNDSNLRIKAKFANVTKNGFDWMLDAWGGTTVYSAGASYIAFNRF